MSYALIVNSTIQTIGGLPSAARRLDTGEWVCPLAGSWSPAQIAACGYVQVVGTSRPPDTATTTFDYSVTLVSGVPTETWTERPKTQAEIDAATASSNADTLRTRADAALTANANYLAIASPTTAQAVAQTKTLTKECNALIRLVISRLDSLSDT